MSALALAAWLAPAAAGLLAPWRPAAAGAGPALTAGVGAAALAGASIAPLDRTGGLLLLLVGLLAATVQAYAHRQLATSGTGPRTAVLLGVAASGTAVLVSASSLVAIAAGWSVAGAAFLAVLAAHRHLPSGEDALRRAAAAFAVSDLAIWAAVVLDAAGAAPGSTAGQAVAVLLVLAAAARAAQLPLQGWLVTTVAAPAPVCAFLHAGIVNAGGILLLRQQDVLAASTFASALAVAIGAATMLTAAIAMAVRPDVKGMLACSTSAQMGFMLVTCGLGAWAATIIHITGHALYKAAGFLGAGGAIADRARRRIVPAAPERRRPALHAALAGGAPAAGLAAAAAVVGVSDEKAALLVFAWVTGAAALWSALPRTPQATDAFTASAAGAAVAAGYLLAATGLDGLLALPEPATALPAWLALVPLGAAGGALLAWRHGGAARDLLYVHAMRLSRPRPIAVTRLGALRAPVPRPAAALRSRIPALVEGGRA